MRISQNTLCSIASLLRAEGVPSVDIDQLSDALASMTDETVPADVNLQPGEVYLLTDDYANDTTAVECSTIKQVTNEIEAYTEERGYGDDISNFTLYVARKLDISAKVEMKLTVTPSRRR